MTAKLLWRLVIKNVMEVLEYRSAYFIYQISNVAGPTISLLVWLTVSEQGVRLPYTRSQFVTYYVLLSIVVILTSPRLAEWLADRIRLGDISPWLLRPAPFILGDIANVVGERVVKVPLLVALVGVVARWFRTDLHLPAAPHVWLLFGTSLLLAATVAFLIDFVLGSLAFWIADVHGLIRVKTLVGGFLAGEFLPLALFPRSSAGFLEAQPFRYTVSFPLEVLTGNLSAPALLRGFMWQATYCILFWGVYRLVWHFGVRAYSAAGT